MLKRIPGFLLVVVLLFSLIQCAKKGMPEGGPEDEDPPKFVRASPENYSTNFNRDEIRIFFNEYVKLDKPQQQIIISPPMDPDPSILPLGNARKDVRIEIFDTLQENTTYTINFGKSIIDNNEGNPLPYFKYVFSTGDYIDSLSVSGRVEDAYLKEPEEFISVFLYEVDSTFSDSVVYNQTPRYVTYTLDTINTFELENLKEGTYHMVAITDKNDNYRFNPANEKIGFIDNNITIPTDSTFALTVFKEELEFEAKRPKQFKGQQIIFGYEGTTDFDSLNINLLNPKPEEFEARIVQDRKTDTLHYWYKPELETDSLSFEVVTSKRRDTLFTTINEMERDSLQLTTAPSGSIEFTQNLRLQANTPLVAKNDERIVILDQDSAEVPFSTELRLLENELVISFDKTENNQYNVTALPGAVTDLFEKSNDTLTQRLRTKAYADYGNVVLQLQNVPEYPVIAQLTNPNGEVQSEQYSTGSNTFTFQYLKPGDYLIRVIFDENENEKWDTGNYLQRPHPEEIRYFPDTLEVRANWDLNQTFILD